LLQAVLDEPLIPLNKQERHYTFILQRNKNENDDDDSLEEEENNVLSTMDKRQMALEEEELVKLATRPIIPADEVVVMDQDYYVQQDPSPSRIVQQGPLVWIIRNYYDSANNSNNKYNNKNTPCHVQLHACGILTVNCCGDEPYIFYLTHLTTCEPSCVNDSQLFQIHISDVVSQEKMQTLEIKFQADSLTVGYAWVTFLNQVIQELKQGAGLQNELHQEWKGEYENVVMAKQQKGVLSSIIA
jgi:hypothetical protein